MKFVRNTILATLVGIISLSTEAGTMIVTNKTHEERVVVPITPSVSQPKIAGTLPPQSLAIKVTIPEKIKRILILTQKSLGELIKFIKNHKPGIPGIDKWCAERKYTCDIVKQTETPIIIFGKLDPRFAHLINRTLGDTSLIVPRVKSY